MLCVDAYKHALEMLYRQENVRGREGEGLRRFKIECLAHAYIYHLHLPTTLNNVHRA